MPGSLGSFVFRLSLVWSDLGRFWVKNGSKMGLNDKSVAGRGLDHCIVSFLQIVNGKGRFRRAYL